jgi:hypothetical protein
MRISPAIPWVAALIFALALSVLYTPPQSFDLRLNRQICTGADFWKAVK